MLQWRDNLVHQKDMPPATPSPSDARIENRPSRAAPATASAEIAADMMELARTSR